MLRFESLANSQEESSKGYRSGDVDTQDNYLCTAKSRCIEAMYMSMLAVKVFGPEYLRKPNASVIRLKRIYNF
jgi:hypothetical protein